MTTHIGYLHIYNKYEYGGIINIDDDNIIYISPNNYSSAIHQDLVKIHIIDQSNNLDQLSLIKNNPEFIGKIIKYGKIDMIISRNQKSSICGILYITFDLILSIPQIELF